MVGDTRRRLAPLIVADDTKHSHAERRYFVLGQTDENRALCIAFTS